MITMPKFSPRVNNEVHVFLKTRRVSKSQKAVKAPSRLCTVLALTSLRWCLPVFVSSRPPASQQQQKHCRKPRQTNASSAVGYTEQFPALDLKYPLCEKFETEGMILL